MKKIILFLFLISITGMNIFSQEITVLNDSTLISGAMVSPTNNAEAMEAYNTGTALMRQTHFKEAESFLLKAIELDSKFVDAMDHLGLVYRNLGRYEDAEYWYKKSIDINPNNIVPYLNLAIAYRFQWRLEDARQTYLIAQRIDPDNPEPYFGIGMLYQLAEQYQTSIEIIRIAMQIYSERDSVLIFNAFYAQGNNYYYLEEFEEALRFYELAFIHHSNNTSIQNRIIELKGKLNKN